MKKFVVLFVLMIAFMFGTAQKATCGGDNKNHIAVFNGLTNGLYTGGGSYYSLGFDYERHLTESLGIGGLLEFVFASGYTQTIIGVPVFEHFGDFKVLVAPAMEFYSIGDVSYSYFLFRAGAGYDFHAGTFSITPGINVDFVNSHVLLVAGISIGIGF